MTNLRDINEVQGLVNSARSLTSSVEARDCAKAACDLISKHDMLSVMKRERQEYTDLLFEAAKERYSYLLLTADLRSALEKTLRRVNLWRACSLCLLILQALSFLFTVLR